ncbi:hypothetical protein CPB83DRAFT_476322 [Crepidotus variabilis]|uniref:RING-type domain-containing protein n=1 Tax=Crepidotus variabilis TaxID=179855 RepID=A0A9P6ERS5_9AGAR|nr:hypothetical protein CPB83DRAFT_476322 [Crepidotus variabilis]
MGNSSSSSSSGRGHQDETVDYGALVPQGVYTGTQDWNQQIVAQLIVSRKLAPFYRPLEDYEDSWDDEQILAARKELPDPDNADTVTRIETTSISSSHSGKSRRSSSHKEPAKPEAQVYRGAVECPICFLYYPANINRSRCCDQAICTECFVQIKRSEPTTTHIVSEQAACPYCVQENFGVTYCPPQWRAGLGSDHGSWSDISRSPSEPTSRPTHKRRQKSFGADSPEVVLTDHIRPDWEAKLEAVRAAVARRANRRIIMRQVGDRLIPVGVTSGRVHALSPEEAAAAESAPSSRRNRRRGNGGNDGNETQYMGMSGQDLEELMMMEAMRLSLLEHEEHQRKEAVEKKKKDAETAAAASPGDGAAGESSSSSVPASTIGPLATLNMTTPSMGGSGPSSPTRLTVKSNSLHPSSSNPNLSSSSQGGHSPTQSSRHGTTDSVDSLIAGRKSWSISRSKTPPPPSQAQKSTSSVPAFSTLRAAMASTSTAAAVLRSSSSASNPDASTPVPTITLNDPSTSKHAPQSSGDTTTTNGSVSTVYSEVHSTDPSHIGTNHGDSSERQLSPLTNGTSSSTISGAENTETSIDDSVSVTAGEDTDTERNGYGVLESSPESVAREPLLAKGGAGSAGLTMHIEEVLK